MAVSTPSPAIPTTPDEDLGRTAIAFLSRIFPAPRSFAVRLWDGSELTAYGKPRFTLVITDPAALRGMFRPPAEASLANAYISGRLEIEGDLVEAFAIIDHCRRAVDSIRDILDVARHWRALPDGEGRANGVAVPPAPLAGQRHSPERDLDAVRHHYDLGNDFFELFLDPRMVYSCAYFPTGTEDLATAQLLKLDLVCRKLRLRPGERLLDVGCGWGAFLIHAAREYGIGGVGITLSRRQYDLARQRVDAAGLRDRIEIRLADYRSLGGEWFDKAASIGMFEHVGEANLREYFRRVYEVVRPGGLFLNHGISIQRVRPRNGFRGFVERPLERLFVGTAPLTRSVFPDTELIPLSDVLAAAEDVRWEVRDVENLREHYARTLRCWIRNLDDRREDAERLVGRATFRAWRLYFAASAHRFEIGRLSLNQTLLAKLDHGRADVPPSRADIYA